jgi:hypothetical protein
VAQAFEDLVAEAEAVSVDGWDFSWLDGRASEARPSWGYARMMGERMAAASAALDIQTGGGEVLAGVRRRPHLTVATESWAPNVARATRRLHARGVPVVVHDAERPLPFGASAFDLVVCRHPVGVWWQEIARAPRWRAPRWRAPRWHAPHTGAHLKLARTPVLAESKPLPVRGYR